MSVDFDFPREIAAQLAESRADAESLMVDACTISRVSGVPDEVTGEQTWVVLYPNPAWPADHPWKSGKCKVQALDPQESTPDAGGHAFTVQRYRVDVPVGSYKPEVGDVATITASVEDPYLVAREFHVVALLHKSLATAYRLAVTDQVA